MRIKMLLRGLSLAVCLSAAVTVQSAPFKDGDRVVFFGDSGDHGPKESNRGVLRRSQLRTTVPAEFIVARGYAFLTACYAQVSPDVEVKKGDTEELAYTRVFELWGKRDESRADNTTALGAWAWALSRGLDLAETIPEIYAKRCVATGSSRLGKAAPLASARDERFAVCVPNQTGGASRLRARRAIRGLRAEPDGRRRSAACQAQLRREHFN